MAEYRAADLPEGSMVAFDRKLPPLHPAAIGFSAFRGLPNGAGRQYSATQFTRGWSGAEQFLRQLRACGYVRPSSAEPSYAVLDALDAEGDVVQDFDIPHASAFRYIKRKLRLTVEHPPPEED